jgi:hypothetical protein
VLAQCNSFIAMRLSNPEDQHYVAKVISDHFMSLIQLLPILRPGEAFVIGDSVIMPMRTLVNMPEPTPQSGNIDFFKFWAEATPNYDIDEIINHWRRQDRQSLGDSPTDDAPPTEPPAPEPAVPEKPSTTARPLPQRGVTASPRVAAIGGPRRSRRFTR